MPKIQFNIFQGVSKSFLGPPSTLSRNQNFKKSDFSNLPRFCHPISASYWSGGPKFIDRLLDSFFKTWSWLRAGVRYQWKLVSFQSCDLIFLTRSDINKDISPKSNLQIFPPSFLPKKLPNLPSFLWNVQIFLPSWRTSKSSFQIFLPPLKTSKFSFPKNNFLQKLYPP